MNARDLTYTDDLIVANGDLVVSDSDQQHVQHIMTANKGHYYQWPTVGVGLVKYRNSNIQPMELRAQIIEQLTGDNYNILTVEISGTGDKRTIAINAERIK